MKLKPSDAIALQKKMGIDVGRDLRRPKRTREDKAAAALFAAMCFAHGIPAPHPEYRFHQDRKWRFDWAWARRDEKGFLENDVALEIQGGIWTGGRHVRGKALLDEMEKLNAAACMGWRVLFCTHEQVNDGSIFPVILRALEL